MAIGSLVIALALVAAGCGGSSSSTQEQQRALTDVRSASQLPALFAAHKGEPRLVLIMSPT